jgi:hypothetical protein
VPIALGAMLPQVRELAISLRSAISRCLVVGLAGRNAEPQGLERPHRPGDTGHIVGMGVAYVAMLAAFYVENRPTRR